MNEHVVFLLQLVITGIAVGAVYSLMALGLRPHLQGLEVVNFGPGELVLFGAYVAWATILNMKLPLAVALPLTLVVAILLGLVIERGVLRPLIGEPIISVIMVTFGFASVVRGVLNMTWGSDTRPFPALFSSRAVPLRADPDLARPPVELRGGHAPAGRRSRCFSSSPCWAWPCGRRRTTSRWRSRSGSASRGSSRCRGASPRWSRRWAASSWAACAAASTSRSPTTGSRSSRSSSSGGLDSVAGAIIGGVLIGVLENLSGGYLDPVFGGGVKEVAPFVVLVVILMIRPYGLFGKRRRRARLMQCGDFRISYARRRAHLRDAACPSSASSRCWSRWPSSRSFAGTYWLDVLNRIGIAIIGALGLNILVGYTGQISIGHAAFLAVGAYATAILGQQGRAAVLARHPGWRRLLTSRVRAGLRHAVAAPEGAVPGHRHAGRALHHHLRDHPLGEA